MPPSHHIARRVRRPRTRSATPACCEPAVLARSRRRRADVHGPRRSVHPGGRPPRTCGHVSSRSVPARRHSRAHVLELAVDESRRERRSRRRPPWRHGCTSPTPRRTARHGTEPRPAPRVDAAVRRRRRRQGDELPRSPARSARSLRTPHRYGPPCRPRWSRSGMPARGHRRWRSAATASPPRCRHRCSVSRTPRRPRGGGAPVSGRRGRRTRRRRSDRS